MAVLKLPQPSEGHCQGLEPETWVRSRAASTQSHLLAFSPAALARTGILNVTDTGDAATTLSSTLRLLESAPAGPHRATPLPV